MAKKQSPAAMPAPAASTAEGAYINQVTVKGLFDKTDIHWPLRPDVNVLVGKNGSGKSTLLRGLYAALVGELSAADDGDSRQRQSFAHSQGTMRSITVGFGNGDSCTQKWLDPEEESELKDFLSELIEKLRQHEAIAKNGKIDFKKFLKNAQKVQVADHDPDVDSPTPRLLKDIYVEYISTFDMLLLSKKERDEVTDEVYTQLDSLLVKEVNRMAGFLLTLNNQAMREYRQQQSDSPSDNADFSQIRTEKFRRVEQFKQVLIDMFEPNGKQVEISDNGELAFSEGGKALAMSQLSSGEKQLLLILLRVLNTSDKPTILLLDEPEISLHLSWQEILIQSIRRINERCQLIIVTHSPAIVMNGWMDCYVELADISQPAIVMNGWMDCYVELADISQPTSESTPVATASDQAQPSQDDRQHCY